MASLSPRTVLITGANRGLGLEFVRQFLQLPSPPKILFAGCRKPDQASDLQDLAKKHENLRVVQLDISDDESIESVRSLVEGQVGEEGLNLLLNNAGVNGHNTGLDTLTRQGLNNHFDANVAGPILVAKSFHQLLKTAAARQPGDVYSCNRAAVVNISSVMGLIDAMFQRKVLNYEYCSSKCALNMAAAILANELSPDGILVASLHPGWVRTDMGGPKGMLEIPDSVSQCLNTITKFDQSVCGRMVRHDGHVYSWSDSG